MFILNLIPQALAVNAGNNPGVPNDVIGNVTLPGNLPSQVDMTGPFISGVIRFLIVVAGLFSLWNFLSGGFQIITSGADKAKMAEAQNKIMYSIVGLVVIAASFLIAGIAGQLLFGNFTAILNPQLETVK